MGIEFVNYCNECPDCTGCGLKKSSVKIKFCDSCGNGFLQDCFGGNYYAIDNEELCYECAKRKVVLKMMEEIKDFKKDIDYKNDEYYDFEEKYSDEIQKLLSDHRSFII